MFSLIKFWFLNATVNIATSVSFEDNDRFFKCTWIMIANGCSLDRRLTKGLTMAILFKVAACELPDFELILDWLQTIYGLLLMCRMRLGLLHFNLLIIEKNGKIFRMSFFSSLYKDSLKKD